MNRRIQPSTTGMNTSVTGGFFLGQAIILLSFPYEVFAFFSALPGWVEAQANEALIVSLGAYIPFVILWEIAVWVAFARKQTRTMLVATMAPIIVLAILAISGYLF